MGIRRLRHDVAQLDAKVDDGLRDLRADAADNAISTHQPRRGDGLQEVLSGQRVNRGNTGDIDDRDRRAGIDDALKQVFHHHLGASAVERADQW
jgi:hypothetical protein